MKIALGQTNIIWEDKNKNIEKCKIMIEKASKNNCDIIVFPEMSLTGFTMNTEKMSENFENSKTIKFFSEMSKKYNIYIGFGLSIKENEKSLNKFIVCDDKGNIICNYSKIHPFSFGMEKDYYMGGESVESFSLKGIKCSPLICYDLRFPEIFQICSKESLIIFVIANWPSERINHWDLLLKSRAIENQCFIAGVNRTGKDITLNYNGHSRIINPFGESLTELTEEESLIIYDIEPKEAVEYRKSFKLKLDRREDIYKKYY